MTDNPVVGVLVSFMRIFWIFIPALVPNSAAVIFGGGKKMDFGFTAWDGIRIFGDGKTWRGFFGGWATGFAFGLLQILISHPFDSQHFGLGPLPMALIIVFTLPLFSLLGDLTGSFIKRRMGLSRGEPAPLLDQYDFFTMTVILSAVFYWNWFVENFIEGYAIWGFLLMIVITYFLHRSVNIIGYRMGKKKEPW